MTTGILLMAYGTPETPADVEAYFTHIRGGRTPSPEAVAHLIHRYEMVGGRTPLLDITQSVRDKLEVELNADDAGAYRVYVGMKHWHPYIADVIPRIAADGVDRLVCIALAPHYSRMSIGAYRAAVENAVAALDHPFELQFVDSWHLRPEFVQMMGVLVQQAISGRDIPGGPRFVTVFSAHSLPERIRTWQDPYERQLYDSARAVAEALGLHWRIGWQSAGNTGEPWIGPDICELLEMLHADGVTHVLQVPIGFVCDHLEVLFDVDIEARAKAESLGVTLWRTEMPNDRAELIDVLAAIVRSTVGTSAGAAA